MKILLILPAAEHLRVTDDGVPKRKMLRFSVLSLTTVAALTPPQHEVTLCDENVQPLDFDAPCDVVGVSFMTALAPRAYEIAAEFRPARQARRSRRLSPHLPPGGGGGTFRRRRDRRGRRALAAGAGRHRAGPAGPFYRAATPPDLAAAPVPRRDLTAATGRHYVTTYAVQTGRGCRHGCKFCSITAFARGTHRSRPLEHVLEELNSVPRHFMFVDDNIIADPEYAKQLFRAWFR